MCDSLHGERVDLTAGPSGGVVAGVSRAPEEGVDLAEQAVTQVVGSFVYAANARALRAQADAERSLFDMLA